MSSPLLTPEEVARTHADVYAGYDLISYGEIGLPYFELRIRAQILERTDLNPFAKFIARAVSIGIGDTEEIRVMLGIDDRVLEATIVELVVREQVTLDQTASKLELTAHGAQVLEAAMEVRPVATQLSVNFDCLLQDVVAPFGDYLQPRDLRSRGIREVPIPVRLQPDLDRIDVRDVERVVREIGGGREQLHDVLALKSMRRFRVFQPAVALVYRSHATPETRVDIAIDGARSERHSLAFAREGLSARLGLDVPPERAETWAAPFVGKEVAKILQDEGRNAKMRELKQAVRAAEPQADASTGETMEAPPGAQQRADRAREILAGTGIKAIETYEHPGYLEDALANSTERVILVSPWLRAQVMDRTFMDSLETLLERAVAVYIGWGISKSEEIERNADRGVLRRLDELGKRYPSLRAHRLGNTHAKVLISDSRYVIVTSFNWLSFRGDPKRTFRDERGTLISTTAYVDGQARDWIERIEAARHG